MLNVLIERSPEQVWQVLSDGWAYADWVAGTRNIHDVDDRWPEPGAQIHYSLGVGRLTIDDVTTVRMMEPCRLLELEAYAGRLGSARISIELLHWAEDRTVVIVDEHPLTGLGARWHSFPVEAALRLRNRRMMSSLASVVYQRDNDRRLGQGRSAAEPGRSAAEPGRSAAEPGRPAAEQGRSG